MIDAEKDDSVVPASFAAWFFGLALAVCYVGLCHEGHYLQFTHDAGIEQGEGLDDRVAFDKDVSAAALGKRLGFMGIMILGALALLTAGGRNRLQFSMSVSYTHLTLPTICSV